MAGGGLDAYATQQRILDYIQTSMSAYEVQEGAIPNGDSIPLVDGQPVAFVLLRFSESNATDGALGGPLYDEYASVVDVLCFAPDPDKSRQMSTYVDSLLLSRRFQNTGSLYRAPGVRPFTILNDANRQPLLWVTPKSFRYLTNVDSVATF